MKTYRLSGTYYEMGVAHGQTLAQAGVTLPPASPEKLQFADACAEIVADVAPELLDELQGVADASDLDLRHLHAFALTLGEGAGCSVVAIAGTHTQDGTALFGRNFDFVAWDGPYQQLYRTYPTGGLASLGCTDVLVGREDGINAAGLVMAQTHVAGHAAQPGVLFSLVGRMLLDQCRTVDEAVTLLERVPHVRANNWVLMDATHTIAVVETSAEHVAATYAPHGFAVATNHFRQPDMRGCEVRTSRPADSHPRLCTLETWFAQHAGQIDQTLVRAVLGGHDAGVCVHRGEGPDALHTLRC